MDFEFDFSEMFENLENLELNLLDFNKQLDDGKVNTDGIHTSFRYAHNLKGIFALVQKNVCSSIIHAVESNFDLIRKGKEQISTKLIEKSLAAIDLVRDFIENEYEDENEAQKVIEQLNLIFKGQNFKQNKTNAFTDIELDAAQLANLQKLANYDFDIYLVEKLVKSDISEEFYNSMPILENILQIGEIIAVRPSYLKIQKVTDEIVLKILFATKCTVEELEYIVFDPFRKIYVEKEIENATAVNTPANKASNTSNFLLYVPNFVERAKISQKLNHKFCCFSIVSLQEVIDAFQFSKNENTPFTFFFSTDSNIYENQQFIECFQEINNYYKNKSIPVCTIVDDLNHIPDANIATAKPAKLEQSKQDIEDFLSSANEIIEDLEKNIIELEKTKSDKNILEIFRLIHNLKGDAAFVSLQTISDYAHNLENLYVQLKNKELIINQEITNLLLESNDFIKNAITTLNRDHINIITQEDVRNLQDKIYTVSGKTKLEQKPEITDTKEKVFLLQIEEFTFMIKEGLKHIHETDASKGMVSRALQNMIKASKYKNAIEIQTASENTLEIIKSGNIDNLQGFITNIFEALENYKENIYKTYSTKEQKPQQTTDVKPTETTVELTEIKTMRINEQKIDTFYNLVGELLIARNAYDFLLNDAQQTQALQVKAYRDNLHLFSRLISNLQSEVNTMRMLPISRITQKFNRVIFDIAKSQNKTIEFRAYGVETEVDKKVAELLSEPLIHIIRNACDHGIELPLKRSQNGKPETGIIELNARREGGNLILKITDDGAGIDKQKLISKANQIGFDISRYNDESILNIIFEAGFSTKQQVTGLSGRGVGMDIVKTTLERLNGNVQVQTEIEKGTTIILTVPISIGVNKSLLVESENQLYALPFESILKIVKLADTKIKLMYDRFVFHFRDEVIVLSQLSNLLHQKQENISLKNKIRDVEQNILLLKTSQGKIGVIVDKLHSNMELIVKPLPVELAGLDKFSGVSILGNGKVVLMINPEKIV